MRSKRVCNWETRTPINPVTGRHYRKKHEFLFVSLELCNPVRLDLSPGHNCKCKATALKFEAVFILARFPDYVPERHFLADLQEAFLTGRGVDREASIDVFARLVPIRRRRIRREHRGQVLAEGCVLVKVRDCIQGRMLGVQEVDREDEGTLFRVLSIEVRFVIQVWRPLGIGYNDEVPLLPPG